MSESFERVPPAQPPEETPAGESAALEKLEDRELMRRAMHGERTPYAVLFQRHAARIWRMGYLILHSGDSADDVVQDTFERGLSNIHTYLGQGDPGVWFSSIALNVCRHYLRARHRQAELTETSQLEQGRRPLRPRTQGVVTNAIRRESSRKLMLALGYLTEPQREVFVLHYINGLPYEDVGKILGIRPGAARGLAHRARAVLRDKLALENQKES